MDAQIHLSVLAKTTWVTLRYLKTTGYSGPAEWSQVDLRVNLRVKVHCLLLMVYHKCAGTEIIT